MAVSVVLVDYGLGNVGSLARALRALGVEPLISSRPEDVARASHLLLPGDGAFGYGMEQLRARGLVAPLAAYVESGRPFLGICVGMQLLMTEGLEFGRHAGLGLVPGRVVPFPPESGAGVRFKVPHVGWNRLTPAGEDAPPGAAPESWRGTILEDVRAGDSVYFIHSFLTVPDDPGRWLAWAEYGGQPICAALHRGNVWGCQFHPEKSGPVGLRILRAFLQQMT